MRFIAVVAFLSIPLLADERVERWRADIAFAAEELEARHAKVDHTVSRADLRAAFAALQERLPKLRDDEIVVELARITALIGDGHTGIFFFSNRGKFPHRQIPIELWAASDGWLILATDAAHSSLLGNRVLRIGSADIEDVHRAVVPLMPRDNEESLRGRARRWMVLAELLQTLGFIESADEVPLLVEDAAEHRRTVVVRPVPRDTRIAWKVHGTPLWLRDRSTKYWMEYLPDSRILYVQFNSADIGTGEPEQQFIRFTEALVQTVEERQPEKLVLDLRWNSGGSFVRTRHLLWALIRSERVNQEGKLFTILSPTSFSAAVSLATELDQHTKTLFAGEPPGSRPNSYGDLGRIYPPHSGIEIRYSRYYDARSLPEDTRPTIFPDLLTPLSIADYRAGRDPALDAIRQYAPPQSIADVIAPIALSEGVAAALDRYRALRSESYNRYSWTPSELDRVATKLQEAKRPQDAIAILRYNTELHPWWAWGHARLGYSLIEIGQRAAGLEEYRRAFELDKRMEYYREEKRR